MAGLGAGLGVDVAALVDEGFGGGVGEAQALGGGEEGGGGLEAAAWRAGRGRRWPS